MSLTTALTIAQNSLLNTQRQTSVVSNNIANAQNGDYARRSATLSSLHPGARIVGINRAVDTALFTRNLTAISGWTAQSKITNELDRLNLDINGVDHASSPAVLMGKFQEASQIYSTTPSNRTLAESAVETGRELTHSLNDSSLAIQSFRARMDQEIATGVEQLNGLLADFKTVNTQIVRSNITGRDANDALDTRDAILKKISELVPISTIARKNDDLMIFTTDGATLFETDPRTVTFETIDVYDAQTQGNRIYIDGVPVKRTSGANTNAGGSLMAMMQLRDSFAVEMQTQLDEIARGLITAFSETDPNSPAEPLPGFFVAGTDMPAAGTFQPGLAGSIRLHDNVDTMKGANAERLRDGVLFDFNTSNHASYNDRLLDFVGILDEPMTLTANGGIATQQSLKSFATGSVSWLEDSRKTASTASQTKNAMMLRTSEVLSNTTNVNVDEEMALMLTLEQSYSASAKMLQVVDNMLQTLMATVR